MSENNTPVKQEIEQTETGVKGCRSPPRNDKPVLLSLR